MKESFKERDSFEEKRKNPLNKTTKKKRKKN